MRTTIVSLLAVAAVCIGAAMLSPTIAIGDRKSSGIDKEAEQLYAAIKQAREDLREMRKQAGLHPHAAGPHIDPEGHHDGDSPEQHRRERAEKDGHEDGHDSERGHREGREHGHGERDEHGGHSHEEGGVHEHGEGEHSHGERGEHGHGEKDEHGRHGEHGGREAGEHRNSSIAKMQKHDKVYKNGARLILKYNPNTQAFVGSVENTSSTTLDDVRVEIHLSNGKELGPTKRVSLRPGKRIPVELSALDQHFTRWVTHPETGNEQEHGEGDEARERHAGHGGHDRERGEHGGRGEHGHGHGQEGNGEHGSANVHEGHGPGAAQLRPVYNQIQLLRGEMRAFESDLKRAKKRVKKKM